MYSIKEKDVQILFIEILKFHVLRPLLKLKYMCRSISISSDCDIKITNAKGVTDASIWVMFTSRNTLAIAGQSLFNFPIVIRHCGFHFRSNDLANKSHS